MKSQEHVDNQGILVVLSNNKWIFHIVQDRKSLCLVRSCPLAIRVFIANLIYAGIGAGIFLCVFRQGVGIAKLRTLD